MALRTPTIVQTAKGTYDNTGATFVTPSLSNVIAGNTVVLLISTGTTTTSVPTVDNGWYQVGGYSGVASNIIGRIYARHNCKAGTQGLTVSWTGTQYGAWQILELNDCDYLEVIESAGGTGTAVASGGSNTSQWWNALLIGIMHVADVSSAGPPRLTQSGTLSGVTAGYSLYDSTIRTPDNDTAIPPVLQNDMSLYVYTQTITDILANPSIAATDSSSDKWGAAVLVCVRLGRVLLTGFESGTVSCFNNGSNGTIGVGQKRTGSGGASGYKIAAAAASKTASLSIPNMASDYYFHAYFRAETLPASSQPVLWLGRGVATVGGAALGYDQGSGGFSMTLYSEVPGGGTPTSVATQTGTTLTAATWYRVEMYVTCVANEVTVKWWIDGSVQTDVSNTNNVTANAQAWVQPPRNIGMGMPNSVTAEYWYDDMVFIADREFMTGRTRPYGALSVAGVVADGHGTDVDNARFQDNGSAAWGTPDYTKLTDAMPGTADYVKQVTIGTTSYVELTNANPSSVSIGAATVYCSLVTKTTDTRLILGGDDYPIGEQCPWSPSATQGAYFSTDACASWGSPYSQTDVNAMLLRFGYAHTVATPPRLTSYVIEVVGFPTVVAGSGGDAWGGGA